MKTLFYVIFFSVFSYVASNFSCDDIFPPEPPEPTILYQNSFEHVVSLVGWQGLTYKDLRDDPAPEGGKRSVSVAGGCMFPQAKFTMPPVKKNTVVTLQCFGKNKNGGGMVGLAIGKNPQGVLEYAISDTSWMQYQTDKNITWPADSTLTIYMHAGGIVPGEILVDKLKLLKIE